MIGRWPHAPRGRSSLTRRARVREPPAAARCRHGGGEPATPQRGGARRAGAPRRRAAYEELVRAHQDIAFRTACLFARIRRRRGGRRAGGVREGVARAAALPRRARRSGRGCWRSSPTRRATAAAPPGAARASRCAAAADERSSGGRGSVSRGRRSSRRRAPRALLAALSALRRARPRGDRLPLSPRPLRARDGGGPGLPARDGEVAPVAGARAHARRSWSAPVRGRR